MRCKTMADIRKIDSHKIILFFEVFQQLIWHVVLLDAFRNVDDVFMFLQEPFAVRQEKRAFYQISKEVQRLVISHFDDLFLNKPKGTL